MARTFNRLGTQAQPNFTAKDVFVVGAGQSLMKNLKKDPNDGFDSQGGNAFEKLLSDLNPNGRNVFVNSGDGSSCLLRSVCITTGQADQDDYWIDDCGYYASGTAYWNGTTGVKSYFRGDAGAPAPTLGVRFNDMLADIAAAGLALADIKYGFWSQGESEATTLSVGSITQTQYETALTFLFAKFLENLPSAVWDIVQMDKRATGSNPTGFEQVRDAQRNVAEALSYVNLAPCMTDLQMRNDSIIGSYVATAGQTTFSLPWNVSSAFGNSSLIVTKNGTTLTHTTDYTVDSTADTFSLAVGATAGDVIQIKSADSLHRSPKGTRTEGLRLARRVLKQLGLYTGNSVGAKITSATVAAGVITATVTHDAGTTLTNVDAIGYQIAEGKPVSVHGTVSHLSLISGGAAVPLQKIEIASENTVRLTLSDTSLVLLDPTTRIYTGYGDMLGLDAASIIMDNAADNPLPLQLGKCSITGVGAGWETSLASMSNLVSFFSPESGYNAAGSANDAVVWTKRAGSGGSARKDDAKAAPIWYADSNMGLAIPGFYFDGTASQKLLVDTALTTSDNVTMFVAFTPDHDATDATTGSSTNAIITTSGVAPADNALFGLSQTRTALGASAAFSGGQGNSTAVHNSTPGVVAIRRNSTTASFWDDTGKISDKTISVTPTVESDGGTPVYAIGNAVDKTAGSDPNQAFIGAIHYVVVFNTALSDAQVNQIIGALKAAVGI